MDMQAQRWEPSWASKNHSSWWPPTLLMYTWDGHMPVLNGGGQSIVSDLERMVRITRSICLALQVKRLRPREGKQLAQDHTANARQRWIWNSNLLAPISSTEC